MNHMATSTQSSHGISIPNPKRQKSIKDVSSVTKISDLPNPVLLHILSFLPTKDVVATGVLSKRWQFLWTSVTSLNFDDHNFPRRGSGNLTFVNIVNRVLLEHNASIQKLRIRCTNSDSCDIEPWVKKAITRKVEELDLNAPGYSEFQLPRSTFSCKTLVVLKLRGQSITLFVPKTAQMPNLKILELHSVSYGDDDSVSNLISCSLSLENLSIRTTAFDEFKELRVHSPTLKWLECIRAENKVPWNLISIRAPLLQHLTIKDHNNVSVWATNTGSLNKVNLELHKTFSWQSVNECFKELIHNVNFLSITGSTPTTLKSESTLPPEKFLNLTHLTLGAKGVWRPMLLNFLQCFKKLEVLKIIKDDFSSITKCPENSWKDPALVPICLISCLRVIRIQDFRESEFELGMLKYMLKNGKVLQKVEVHSADSIYQERDYFTRKRDKAREWEDKFLTSERNYSKLQVKFSIAKKLMKFQRGSQACEIDLF